MTRNLKLFGRTIGLLLGGTLLICALSANGAASFSINPSSVSNTYPGVVTLQVTGLATGDAVVVQKYVDLNTNGVVDASDLLWQQFNLTDGQATVIGGVTNLAVPGDLGTSAGQITAQLDLQSDFSQSIVGKYLFVVSSPLGHFTALTNSLIITNAPFSQQFNGNVVNNSTNVPNAVVLLFQPSGDGMNPMGGAVANNTGGYTIKAAPGTYTLVSFRTNFVANLGSCPSITLGSGQTIVTNLVNTMLTATQNISGKVVDANSPSTGMGGLLLPVQSSSGLLAISTSDTNGNFNARVVASQWKVSPDGQALNTLGYLKTENSLRVDTTTGSVANVTLSLPKANALFYGTVKDNLGNALRHVQLFSEDAGTFLYEADGLYSDQNGNYFAGALAGNWQVNVSSDGNPAFSNYIFTTGTNHSFSAGQSFQYNFTGLLATNHITGHIQYNGNPVSGVRVFANATISGKDYQTQIDTDGSGNYSLTVANGSWSVGVSCQGGDDSLDNILGAGNYQCPNNATVTINNNNQTANFTVQAPSTVLSGRVVDNLGIPVTNMNVFAFPVFGGFSPGGTTDGSGNYQIGISGGSYVVALNTDPSSGAPSRGLVSPSLPVDVTDGVNITGFNLIAQRTTGTIAVSITNLSSHAGVPAVNVSASATLNGTNYQTGAQVTAATGKFSLGVFNGDWDVFADCNSLSSQGLSCPTNNDKIVTIANNTVAVNYTVQPCSLQIITTSLPQGEVGVFYDILLDGSSCSGFLNWAVSSGSFPSALTLDSSGELYGTPDTGGTFNFVVSADDGFGNSTNRPLSLTITLMGQATLRQPAWKTNRFQMLLVGTAGQNYTIQTSTNLAGTNWTTLFITNNAATNAFIITDTKATNRSRFYRALKGP
jgi:hypothetical protein